MEPVFITTTKRTKQDINCTYAFIRRRQNVSAPRAEVRKLLCKGQDRNYILGCTDPVSLSHDSETCNYNGKAILSNM